MLRAVLAFSLTLFMASMAQAVALPGRIVSTDWLLEHLNEPDLRIIQVGGSNYYETLHIPGALLVEFEQLVVTVDGVPGVRADGAQLGALFSSLGIDGNTQVVIYGASGGMDAGRLLWSLAALGHEGAAVLDGGLNAWYQEKKPLEGGKRQWDNPAVFAVTPNPEVTADLKLVEAISQGQHPAILLDVRSRKEYQGGMLARSSGHIPGALHMEWLTTLRDPRSDQRLLDADTILLRLAQLGIHDKNQEVVLYCTTGHRASQVWTVLKNLGFSKVRLYDASMAEWEWRHHKPVIAGDNPR